MSHSSGTIAIVGSVHPFPPSETLPAPGLNGGRSIGLFACTDVKAAVPGAVSPILTVLDRACQSLRSAECDLALAGEVSNVPDVAREGTGAVVLKRLNDALSDGDSIKSVIRGSLIHCGIDEQPVSAGPGLVGEVFREVNDVADLLEALLVVERGLSASVPWPWSANDLATRSLPEDSLPPGWRASIPPRRVVVSASDHQGLSVSLVLEQGPLREAVREPPRQRPAIANEYIPPTNLLEAAIADIWQELLGIDHVGIGDNFFELGGSSITGIKIIALLKKNLRQEIPTISLYEGPTVGALARVILQGDETSSDAHEEVQRRGERRRLKLRRLAQAKHTAPDEE